MKEFWLSFLQHGMPCLFHEATGFYCPGCGGTRAIVLLMTGHPLLSLYCHPLVLYGVISVIYVLLLFIISKLNLSNRPFQFPTKLLWGALILLIVQCAYKNILVLMA